MRPARPAFTLIETLVCLAIVAILTGLLLPAIRAARSSAREVACVAALRSYAQAVHAYASDARDLPPAARVVTPDDQFGWSSNGTTVRLDHDHGGFSLVQYEHQGWFSIYILARSSYLPIEASYCPDQRSIADPSGPGRYETSSMPNYWIPEVYYFRPAVYRDGTAWQDEASARGVQPLSRVRHPSHKVLTFERRVWHLADQPTLHTAIRSGRAASIAGADGSAIAWKTAENPVMVTNTALGHTNPSPWLTPDGVLGRDLH